MYSGTVHAVDREEYLLGKAVDRNVLPARKADDALAVSCVLVALILQVGEQPGAMFMGDDTANDSRDIAKKVREDPMFAIKKKEQDSIRALKNNPVRMKHLKDVRQTFVYVALTHCFQALKFPEPQITFHSSNRYLITYIYTTSRTFSR